MRFFIIINKLLIRSSGGIILGFLYLTTSSTYAMQIRVIHLEEGLQRISSRALSMTREPTKLSDINLSSMRFSRMYSTPPLPKRSYVSYNNTTLRNAQAEEEKKDHIKKMTNLNLTINTELVRHLLVSQFPQWGDLPIRPVKLSGWDNRTFHLGENMLVRLPSAQAYAAQVEKEQKWLPKLAPLLPLPIPQPLQMGEPTEDYPWRWSIYYWLEGDCAASAHIVDYCKIAKDLAKFLNALQAIDAKEGPLPGQHNFFRGGSLSTYDAETRQAINKLRNKIDVKVAEEIWEKALATHWKKPPVWVHGDVTAANLLVKKGNLSALIDFGLLAVGDPACDLAIAWTFFSDKSREVFRQMLPLDQDTWGRGRAWTLWKALILAAKTTKSNVVEEDHPWKVIEEVFKDHKQDQFTVHDSILKTYQEE